MGMKGAEIEKFIKDAFPDAEIEMKDLAGDDNHWAATVKSSAFKGKSRVAQHQMVYAALKGNMGGVLHALQLTTVAQILVIHRRRRDLSRSDCGRKRPDDGHLGADTARGDRGDFNLQEMRPSPHSACGPAKHPCRGARRNDFQTVRRAEFQRSIPGLVLRRREDAGAAFVRRLSRAADGDPGIAFVFVGHRRAFRLHVIAAARQALGEVAPVGGNDRTNIRVRAGRQDARALPDQLRARGADALEAGGRAGLDQHQDIGRGGEELFDHGRWLGRSRRGRSWR